MSTKNNWKVKNIRAMDMTVQAVKKKKVEGKGSSTLISEERDVTSATEAQSVF